MAVTRLGQIGIGVDAYPGFDNKSAQHVGEFTRLVQFGIGGAKYLPFQAKTAAQPQPEEEFVGFPAIRPAIVEGDIYGVLPRLRGIGRGVHGVVGEARAQLSGLVGDAVGEVGTVGDANATLPAVSGSAAAVDGPAGEVRGNIPLLAASSVGSVGARGAVKAVLPSLKGEAIGQHDPDDEEAIITWLLVA